MIIQNLFFEFAISFCWTCFHLLSWDFVLWMTFNIYAPVNWVLLGLDNGLSHAWHQAIAQTSARSSHCTWSKWYKSYDCPNTRKVISEDVGQICLHPATPKHTITLKNCVHIFTDTLWITQCHHRCLTWWEELDSCNITNMWLMTLWPIIFTV